MLEAAELECERGARTLFRGVSFVLRAGELLEDDAAELKLVICHLGQGGSATAVRGGVALSAFGLLAAARAIEARPRS